MTCDPETARLIMHTLRSVAWCAVIAVFVFAYMSR